MCLQSCPRAGIVIQRYVMGHFKETLTAVCSIPSSMPGVLELVADDLKLILTEKNGS